MVPDKRSMPEPANYPGVVKCRGGWFAIWRKGDVGSGPWRTEEAAKAAMNHAYAYARELDRVAMLTERNRNAD
jgi:hypothetical protein